MKIKVDTLLFYISYSLILFVDMFSQSSTIMQIKNLIVLLIIIILFFVVIKNLANNTKKNNIAILCLFIICCMIYYHSKIKEPLLIMLFLLSFQNQNFEKFIGFDYKIRMILLIAVLVSSLLGILPNTTSIRVDGHIRYTFGFGSPNQIGLHLFMLICDSLYLSKNKNSKIYFIFHNAFLIITLLFIYYALYSRTAFIMTLIIVLLFKVKNKMKLIYKTNILKYLYVVLFVISLMMSITFLKYPNKLSNLDRILSYRISYAGINLDYYGLSLFGTQKVNGDSWQLMIGIDNMYMYNLVFYGIFGVIMYAIIFYYIFDKAKKENNHELILIFFIISAYALSEKFLCRITFDPFFIYSASLFWRKKENEKQISINNNTSL